MAASGSAAEERLAITGGILLGLATVAALAIANSPLAGFAQAALAIPGQVSIGDFVVRKPLLLWINDGLMAVFFLLVGLEIKRELMEGRLSRRKDALLPFFGAVGGFIAPALVFLALVGPRSPAAVAWAVPTATDIAFVVAIAAALGRAMPPALRVFLLGLAVIDDLMAIVVIALFYTSEISATALQVAAACLVVLAAFNALGVRRIGVFILVGVVMWTAVLKSGVHATIAGVLLGFSIPLAADEKGHSPLHALEHALKPWVALFIVPVFAFANTGLPLGGIGIADLAAPLTLATALGLFLGKQAGVFSAIWLGVKTGFVDRPGRARWTEIYGAALLTGIGFTMSLFIGSLAVEASEMDRVRLGVLVGSAASALAGIVVLLAARALARPQAETPTPTGQETPVPPSPQ